MGELEFWVRLALRRPFEQRTELLDPFLVAKIET